MSIEGAGRAADVVTGSAALVASGSSVFDRLAIEMDVVVALLSTPS